MPKTNLVLSSTSAWLCMVNALSWGLQSSFCRPTLSLVPPTVQVPHPG